MAQIIKLQPVGTFKKSQPLCPGRFKSQSEPQSSTPKWWPASLSQKLQRSGLSITDLHRQWSYLQFFIVCLSRNTSWGTETKTWGHARPERALTSVSFSFTSILVKFFPSWFSKPTSFPPPPDQEERWKFSCYPTFLKCFWGTPARRGYSDMSICHTNRDLIWQIWSN